MTEMPYPLAPHDVSAMLRAAAETIRAELTALPDEVTVWRPAPGEWCVKEALGHLIETEKRGFAGRIRIILASHDPTLEGWDPDAVAQERRDGERDLGVLLDEFSAMRTDSVDLAAGLSEADLQRGGHHPDIGYVRVVDLLHEWVHHDRNHIRQMLDAVQTYIWPNMGATQLFSQPAADAIDI